ncbi:MAG: tail fiber domain-containing protein, partial [Chthoniobacterales bacterium]
NNLGVHIVSGGSSWSSLSDSNAKTAVKSVDPRAVLAKLDHLPVTEWEYKADPHRRYFGPMAQDFHAAFGLGRDNKTISTLDADGVLFLSVKGLVEELKDRDARIERLESELSEIRKQLSNLPPAP